MWQRCGSCLEWGGTDERLDVVEDLLRGRRVCRKVALQFDDEFGVTLALLAQQVELLLLVTVQKKLSEKS